MLWFVAHFRSSGGTRIELFTAATQEEAYWEARTRTRVAEILWAVARRDPSP